jgi:hypothetical protein
VAFGLLNDWLSAFNTPALVATLKDAPLRRMRLHPLLQPQNQPARYDDLANGAECPRLTQACLLELVRQLLKQTGQILILEGETGNSRMIAG